MKFAMMVASRILSSTPSEIGVTLVRSGMAHDRSGLAPITVTQVFPPSSDAYRKKESIPYPVGGIGMVRNPRILLASPPTVSGVGMVMDRLLAGPSSPVELIAHENRHVRPDRTSV